MQMNTDNSLDRLHTDVGEFNRKAQNQFFTMCSASHYMATENDPMFIPNDSDE